MLAASAVLVSAPASAGTSVYLQLGSTPTYSPYYYPQQPSYYYQQPNYYSQQHWGQTGYRWDNQPRYYGRGRDQDRDGIPNRYDRDLDNDGRVNSRDRDRDGDGVVNWRDRAPDNRRRY